jgi:antitoxin (DNA-binding transcriptional repressor) of toxin-antitoxin stability system
MRRAVIGRLAVGGLIAAGSLTGHPVVQLVAVERAARKPEFGSARGLITLADDFDAPLPDFAEYQ